MLASHFFRRTFGPGLSQGLALDIPIYRTLLGNEVQDRSRNRSHRYVGVAGRGVLVWARPGEALCFARVGVWPAQLPLAFPLPTSSLAHLPHVLSTGIESTGHKESIKSSPGWARERGAKTLMEEA